MYSNFTRVFCKHVGDPDRTLLSFALSDLDLDCSSLSHKFGLTRLLSYALDLNNWIFKYFLKYMKYKYIYKYEI